MERIAIHATERPRTPLAMTNIRTDPTIDEDIDFAIRALKRGNKRNQPGGGPPLLCLLVCRHCMAAFGAWFDSQTANDRILRPAVRAVKLTLSAFPFPPASSDNEESATNAMASEKVDALSDSLPTVFA